MRIKKPTPMKAKHTRKLGFDEGLSGTPMLRCAVNYMAEFPETKKLVMVSEVYCEVAKVFGTTVTAAERNIRFATRKAGYGGVTSGILRDFAQRVRDGEFRD